jgi:hypothetical protein
MIISVKAQCDPNIDVFIIIWEEPNAESSLELCRGWSSRSTSAVAVAATASPPGVLFFGMTIAQHSNASRDCNASQIHNLVLCNPYIALIRAYKSPRPWLFCFMSKRYLLQRTPSSLHDGLHWHLSAEADIMARQCCQPGILISSFWSTTDGQ